MKSWDKEKFSIIGRAENRNARKFQKKKGGAVGSDIRKEIRDSGGGRSPSKRGMRSTGIPLQREKGAGEPLYLNFII